MLLKSNSAQKNGPDLCPLINYFQHETNFDSAVLKIDSELFLKTYYRKDWERATIWGIVVLKNGYPFTIHKLYHGLFVQKCNTNKKDSRVCWEINDKDFLTFQLYFDPSNICCQKISQNIKKSILCIKKKLQVLGNLKRTSKYSISLKQKQLRLKKTTQTLLRTLPQQVQEADQRNSQSKLIQYVQQLKEISDDSDQSAEVRKGGYFQVQKKRFSVRTIYEETQKELAVRKVRRKKINKCDYYSKLEKEWKFIKKIKNPKYFPKYFIEKNEQKRKDFMIMQYIQDSFEMLLENQFLFIKQLINMLRQIVQGVQVLHQSGIVHRDIKACNLLASENSQKYEIKIIDFGESTTIDQIYTEEQAKMIGCTLPYSPIECSIPCQQGFNKKEIDLWSIGILFYEAIFQRIPITYSKCFQQDIYKGWKKSDQFNIFPNIRKKRGIRVVQQIILWISMKAIRIQQTQRLNLITMKKVLMQVEVYLNDFYKS